jgi:hypothetical protein
MEQTCSESDIFMEQIKIVKMNTTIHSQSQLVVIQNCIQIWTHWAGFQGTPDTELEGERHILETQGARTGSTSL